MKKSKKLIFTVLSLGAMALSGCGTKATDEEYDPKHKHVWGEWETVTQPTELEDGKEVSKCTVKGCTKEKENPIPALGFLYHVTFKNADGTVIKTEDVRSVAKVSKPEDPVAPLPLLLSIQLCESLCVFQTVENT